MSWRDLISQGKAFAGIAQGSRALGAPYLVSLMSTNRCNLRCIHCYFYSPLIEAPNMIELRRAQIIGEKRPSRAKLARIQQLEADPETLRRIIDDLISMGTRHIQFSGYGEPFLYKWALELMGRTKAAGLQCSVNTNGTLLNRERMDALLAMGFDELRITTLAGTAEEYVRTHPGCGETVFESMRENLTYLAERKKATRSRRPLVTLATIVISENAYGLMNFARFAHEVGAERVSFRPFDDVGDEGYAKLIPTAAQAAHVREELGEVETYLNSAGIGHNAGNFRMVFRDRIDTRVLYDVIPCYYGWFTARIATDGSVYPCCRCYDPLGNISERDFREIWNGERYRRFRKEAHAIPRRGTPVAGCDCHHCVNHMANLRVYGALHPLRRRSARIKTLSPACGTKGK